MQKTQTAQAVRTLPTGYIRAWYFDINQRREATFLSLWGAVLMLAAWVGFLALARIWKPQAFPEGFLFRSESPLKTLAFVGMLVLVTLLMIVLHEGLHGLCFLVFTRERPKFALKIYYASAAAPGWYFPRWQYMITALAPLVGITLLCLAALAWLPDPFAMPAFLLLVFNTSGAVGDIWVALRLLTSPPDVYVKDFGDRIEFHRTI
jgi:hypothetical protein